ncbi:MAG: 5'-3' exonuclease H3TH domain-containing protein [Pseudomonadota bacterium]
MVYLIDASVYVFRAWFSVPDDMVDGAGNPTNALFGFTRFLADFLEYVKPDQIAVAFDESLAISYRNQIYPDYKANREPAPPELDRQFKQCRRMASALGLREAASNEYEADDIIGTLALDAREHGVPCTIVSRDKDLTQLLAPGDTFWDFANNKRLGYDDIRDVFGVYPEQIADLLALAGDSVDNIPGVPGVGRKTAAALLNHFGSLDVLYANLDRVCDVQVRGATKLGGKLEAHRDIAHVSRALTVIPTDVPLDFDATSLHRKRPDLGHLNALCDEAGFGPAFRRQGERLCDLLGDEA